MKLKSLQEQRVSLIEQMEVEVRDAESNEKFEELKSQIKAIDAEIRELSLENIKSPQVVAEGEKHMELREDLLAGKEVELRAMSTTNVGAGVPQETVPGVIEKVAEISPLFARARKINTASTSALTVQGTKLGKFVKTAELAAYTQKQATYDEKVLMADKYSLAVTISEELIEDASFDVESDINAQLVEGCALTCNELIATKLEGATGAVEKTVKLDTDGLIEMYYALKPAYRQGAVWVINPEMEIAIAKLKDATGQPLMVRSFTDRPVITILGCEVIVDENITKPMFVNMDKAIVVGLRRNFNVKKDDSIGFLSGSVAIRADIRLDAVATVEEAIVRGTVATK